MRIAWSTDIHLNFCSVERRQEFADSIVDSGTDAVVITGDIAESHNIETLLGIFAGRVNVPVYFVAGNHDYYNVQGGKVQSIDQTRKILSNLWKVVPNIRYLTTEGIVELAPGVALIGHDGWYDGRYGNPYGSSVMLSDFYLIPDLRYIPKQLLLQKIQRLAAKGANHLDKLLKKAVKQYDRVVVATHVPPWRQCATYQGKPSDDDWAPWFTCQAIGDVLDDHSANNPKVDFLVLCGHCFDPSTELLTRNGWRTRHKLSIGDEVVTWNREIKKLEYQPVVKFFDHQFSGQMFRLRTRMVDLMVTPGHGLVDARRCGGGKRRTYDFYNTEQFTNKCYRNFIMCGLMDKKGVDLSDDLIKLVVWIVADGSIEHPGWVRFHFKKERKIKRLLDLVNRLKIDAYVKVQKHGTTKISFNIPDKICHLFSSICSEKQLPESFREATADQCAIILEEYRNTDGSRVSKNAIQIGSAKEQEIDLLQAMFVTSGYRTTKLYRPKMDGGRQYEGWIITVNTATEAYTKTSFAKKEDFNGNVWCASVVNGTLLIRRGGRVCVVQNSHGSSSVQIRSNLKCLTGEARYKYPKINEVFEF